MDKLNGSWIESAVRRYYMHLICICPILPETGRIIGLSGKNDFDPLNKLYDQRKALVTYFIEKELSGFS